MLHKNEKNEKHFCETNPPIKYFWHLIKQINRDQVKIKESAAAFLLRC